MKDGMQHHSMCPIGNGLDRTLGDANLLVSTNIQNVDLLASIGNVVLELD
jgi:hypothetical protein